MLQAPKELGEALVRLARMPDAFCCVMISLPLSRSRVDSGRSHFTRSFGALWISASDRLVLCSGRGDTDDRRACPAPRRPMRRLCRARAPPATVPAERSAGPSSGWCTPSTETQRRASLPPRLVPRRRARRRRRRAGSTWRSSPQGCADGAAPSAASTRRRPPRPSSARPPRRPRPAAAGPGGSPGASSGGGAQNTHRCR